MVTANTNVIANKFISKLSSKGSIGDEIASPIKPSSMMEEIPGKRR